jgi:hypothetical protein
MLIERAAIFPDVKCERYTFGTSMKNSSFPIQTSLLLVCDKKYQIRVSSLLNLLHSLNEIILCATQARIISFYSTR